MYRGYYQRPGMSTTLFNLPAVPHASFFFTQDLLQHFADGSIKPQCWKISVALLSGFSLPRLSLSPWASLEQRFSAARWKVSARRRWFEYAKPQFAVTYLAQSKRGSQKNGYFCEVCLSNRKSCSLCSSRFHNRISE